jgi:hypothetical protein
MSGIVALARGFSQAGADQRRQEGGGEGRLVLEEKGRREHGNSELQPDSAMASGTRESERDQGRWERVRGSPRKRGEGSK